MITTFVTEIFVIQWWVNPYHPFDGWYGQGYKLLLLGQRLKALAFTFRFSHFSPTLRCPWTSSELLKWNFLFGLVDPLLYHVSLVPKCISLWWFHWVLLCSHNIPPPPNICFWTYILSLRIYSIFSIIFSLPPAGVFCSS